MLENVATVERLTDEMKKQAQKVAIKQIDETKNHKFEKEFMIFLCK